MKLFACCFLMLVSVSSVLSVEFTDCGSMATVNSFTIDQCPDDGEECIITTGTAASITVEFDSKVAANEVYVYCYGLSLITLEIDPDEPDACQSGLDCPLVEGGSYTYTGSFNISRAFPAWKVTVQFFLSDEENDIICLKTPVTIKKGE